ncbi:DUF427 domain-containing protein [Maritalea sp.]|jgi:uncharacterized protein (DUF427 family)|uniref:DUF427 domain-containing protein n=1 Tax=Maritalea sp. TaxID=2003361 RepID=UPI0039E32372
MNQMIHIEAEHIMVENIVRNPQNHEHFMHIQPVGVLVEVYVVDELVASSEQAVWLQETGKSVYAPRIYVPKSDLLMELELLDKQTHCPLKGDASYYGYLGKEIAWAYDAPFDFSQQIKGLMSFLPERVRVEIGV